MYSGNTHLSLVSFVGITPAAQVGSEQLRLARILSNDVVHRSLLLGWCHSIDGVKGKTEKAASVSLLASISCRTLYVLNHTSANCCESSLANSIA